MNSLDAPADTGALQQKETGGLECEESEADGQIEQEGAGCYPFGALCRSSVASEDITDELAGAVRIIAHPG